MIARTLASWPILVALLWMLPSGIRAQTEGFLEPAAGARLEPGERVEVVWTLHRTPLRQFDEAELLLSLDGGRSFPLRVTREVSPSTRHLSWRVPSLPAEHARLELRQGSDEDSEAETTVLVGPEFTIVARPAVSWEELFRVRGQWRTRQALESSADLPETGLSDPGSDEMSAAPSRARMAEPPRSVTEFSGRERSCRRFASYEASSAAEPFLSTGRLPFRPLRQ